MRNYFLFSVAVIAAFAVLPFLLLGVPTTATDRGLIMASAGFAGSGISVLALGCLGLLYRPNRFIGFVIGTGIATAIFLFGSQV